MMFDVITVGSATVDAFVQTGNKLFRGSNGIVKVPFGSKIAIDDIFFDIGGGGTNTAVALARLGLKVAFLGKIGKDYNSEKVLELLRKEKVDTSLVKRGNEGTGFSVILDAYRHDRTILTFKGSNNGLDFGEIPLGSLKTKWFYFCSMMNKSFKSMERLGVYAKKNGIKVMFNPSSYLTEKGLEYLRRVVSCSMILVLNKEEAMMLVKSKGIKKILAELHSLGPEIVIVTDGPRGVFVYHQECYYAAKPHKINVVETTGAGDAFGSGFLVGYINTNDAKFALKLGLLNAEAVIQNVGNKHNLPRWSDALKMMKRHPTPILEF
jgi:ribokinase